MENITSVLKSADGPTSIFVAGKTPEIMGALIATVVVGVIIALFGLKIVRVLSALVGLAVGAVIGATVGVIAGFDMTKMLVAVAVCAVILCVMCAALRKFGIFIMTFFGSFGTFVTLLETKSVIVLAICAVIALIVAILTVILLSFCYICDWHHGRCRGWNGITVCVWNDEDWLDRICDECSNRSDRNCSSDDDAVQKDWKERKDILKEDQRTGIYGV